MIVVDTTRPSNNDTIQHAIDQAASAGGGAVHIPAGIYDMRNAIKLRNGVHITGDPGTILRKKTSIASDIIGITGYGHYEIRVADPQRFRIGDGVCLRNTTSHGFDVTVATIIDIHNDLLFIDRMANFDYTANLQATAATLFPIIEGIDIHDASVSTLEIDGNKNETRILNGCRGGGVFLLGCHDVVIDRVNVHDYKADGISFQQCVDITVRHCEIHHCLSSGLHPGSGSVRYVMEHNHVHHNGRFGLFYCLRTTHSRCSHNTIEYNGEIGISIGERDTDHLIEHNTLRHNAGPAIDWRNPANQSGDRIHVIHNTIQNNSGQHRKLHGKHRDIKPAAAQLNLPAGINHVYMAHNTITSSSDLPTPPIMPVPPVSIADGSPTITFTSNIINGQPQGDHDMIGNLSEVQTDSVKPTYNVGPKHLPTNGAKHLGLAVLPPMPNVD